MGTRTKKQGENIETPTWIAWIGATTVGYGLGMTLSSYLVASTLLPLGPVAWGILNVLLYGAVVGIALGAIQFAVMPRTLVPLHWWIVATLAGAAIGFAVAAVACELLANSMDPTKNYVLGVVVIAVVAGVIIGLANGLGQWLVLRRRLPQMRRWTMMSIFGTALGTVMATGLLGLFELPLLYASPSLSVGAIMGLCAGIFQGLIFWLLRRQ